MDTQYSHLTKEFLNKFKAHDQLPLKCVYCQKPFWRRKGDVLSNIKHNRNTYCTLSCASKHDHKNKGFETIVLQCGWCGKDTEKITSQIKKSTSGKMFCSRSCSAKSGNSTKKKCKPMPECPKCEQTMESRRIKMCSMCRKAEYDLLDQLTLADVKYMEGPSGVEAKWAKVRGRARIKYQTEVLKGCTRCGYSKHAEVCHIKSISKFPLTATVGEVNDISNIKILCRNCHWEFDHGILY